MPYATQGIIAYCAQLARKLFDPGFPASSEHDHLVSHAAINAVNANHELIHTDPSDHGSCATGYPYPRQFGR